MLKNLTLSVLRYERVKTTEAKAKEIRRFVDKMINLGKDGSLEARRRAQGWLPEQVIVEKVFAFPGFGSLLVDALQLRDAPLIEATVLITATVYIGANMIADIGSIVLNPRLRSG